MAPVPPLCLLSSLVSSLYCRPDLICFGEVGRFGNAYLVNQTARCEFLTEPCNNLVLLAPEFAGVVFGCSAF